MRYGLLGPVEVRDGDGNLVDLGSRKQRAILAVLALEAGRAVSIDRIVDEVWGGEAPARATTSLHAYISNLRKVLEPDRAPRAESRVLVSRAPGYVLMADPDTIDIELFRRLAEEGRSALAAGDPATAGERLAAALALWRGTPLADVADLPFARTALGPLTEMRLTALEDRVEADLASGRSADLVDELEALVRQNPLRERLWAHLMVALHRAGRRADALRAFERARHVLVEDLGIDPSPALRQLEASIASDDAVLGPPARPEPDRLLQPAPGSLRSPSGPAAAPLPGGVAAGSGSIAGERLVGRAEPMRRLTAQLDHLRHGRGAVAAVTGEAGIGKTALALAVLDAAIAHSAAAGLGRSPEGTVTPVLWPWHQALLDACGGALPAALDAALAEVAGEGRVEDNLSGVVSLGRGLARIAFEVGRAAMAQPMVLCLDDLQWADEPTHQLLRLVLTELRSTPLVILVTVRDDEPAPMLAETLAVLAREPSAERVELRGLDHDAVTELVGQVAAPLPHAVVDLIAERTGGNPFYVTELVGLLRAEHALDGSNAAVREAIPTGVREVVTRRLARLPSQVSALLTLASVLGAEVDARVLAQMASLDLDDVLDQLDMALAAGLVIEIPGVVGRYRFRHDLVHESISATLPSLRRARLHHRAVEAFEAVAPAAVLEVAHHARLAASEMDPDAVVRRLLAGGREALSSLSLERGEQDLKAAVELADQHPGQVDERSIVDAESRLAQIRFHARRDVAAAMAGFRRAAARARAAGSGRRETLLGLGAYAQLWGGLGEAIEVGHELLALAAETGDPVAGGDGHYVLSALMWTGDAPAAVAHLDRCVDAPAGSRPAIRPDIVRAARSTARAIAGDRAGAVADAHASLAAACREFVWSRCWSAFFTSITGVWCDDRAVMQRSVGMLDDSAGLEYVDAWAAALHAYLAADAAGVRVARERMAVAGNALLLAPAMAMEASRLSADGDTAGASVVLAEAEEQARRIGQSAWRPGA